MEILVILSWLLCGLIVGLIARWLVSSAVPLGIVRTLLVGIVGAFVGGLISRGVGAIVVLCRGLAGLALRHPRRGPRSRPLHLVGAKADADGVVVSRPVSGRSLEAKPATNT